MSDHGADCGGVIQLRTLETEDLSAPTALYSVSSRFLHLSDHRVVCMRAQLGFLMILYKVPEAAAPVFVSQVFMGKQQEHKVLWRVERAVPSHMRDSHTHSVLDKYLSGTAPSSYSKTGADTPEQVSLHSAQTAYTLHIGEDGLWGRVLMG